MRYAFLNFLIGIMVCTSLLFSNVLEKIEKIPPKEREELQKLFNQLVFDDDFGYTLFGRKPVSLAGYFKITPYENIIECNCCDELFWNRWFIWEKYSNQFNISNYLLLKGGSTFPNHEYILLINKKEFVNVINRYSQDFERILGHPVDANDLLVQLERCNISLLEYIKNNEMLFGLLLGYGKHNSMVFSQIGKVFKQSSLGYFEIKEIPLSMTGGLSFRADFDHPETKKLKKFYEKIQKKISTIYSNENFLITTLNQLTRRNP